MKLQKTKTKQPITLLIILLGLGIDHSRNQTPENLLSMPDGTVVKPMGWDVRNTRIMHKPRHAKRLPRKTR